MKFSIHLVSLILLFLSINLFAQQKPSLIGLEQDGIHTTTYNSVNGKSNGSDTAILVSWPLNKKGQPSIAGIVRIKIINNRFVIERRSVSLGKSNVLEKLGDILIDDVPIPFERVGGGGNQGGGIPIDTAILIKWPPVKSGNKYTTVTSLVTGYIQNGDFTFVQQSKRLIPTTIGKLGDILINDVEIPFERRNNGSKVEEDAIIKIQSQKKTTTPKPKQETTTLGEISALAQLKNSTPKPKQETTTLGEISAKWDKDKYPYGIVVFNNNSYGYDKAENVQEWLKNKKNLFGTVQSLIPVFVIPTRPIDTLAPQDANGAGTRAAVPSARGRPGLRNEVLIPPPSSQAFFPQIQYKNDVRLVKCYDKDGNEYYVNCPIDEGDCCNLAPLPFIDLTSPAEKKGPAGSGTKPKKETEDVILEGLIKRRTNGGRISNSGGIPIDTAILIKWPPKKNGQLSVAGITTGTFTNNVFVPNQTNIKLGSIDVNAKYGDILIDDVPIPFERVSGGGNPGGGIPIDTAIMIKWPPVKSGNRFSTVSGSVTGYVQNGYFVLVQQSKNATPTVLGKLGDILINDVLIPDERRAPGTEPEKPKGCCCVEEPSPGNFTMVNIDCPGGDCVKCCADVKKEGGKREAVPAEIANAIRNGQYTGDWGDKKYYFNNVKPKQETTTLGEISAKWDKDKFPYGIVVFNNSKYGYDKAENIQEWMKDNKNLKGKGEMPVPVFIIPITPKDTFPTIQAANGAGTRSAVPSARSRPGLRNETAPKPSIDQTQGNNNENGGVTTDPNPTIQYANGAGTRSAIPSTRSKPGLRNETAPKPSIEQTQGNNNENGGVTTDPNPTVQYANGAGTRSAIPSTRSKPGLRREVLIPPPNNTPFFPEIVYGENTRLVKCTDSDGNEYYVNCPEGTEYCCDLAPLPQIDLTTPAENNGNPDGGTKPETTTLSQITTNWDKTKYPYGIVVLKDSQFVYDDAENIQELMKPGVIFNKNKARRLKGHLHVFVNQLRYIIPTTPGDNFLNIQVANSVSTRPADGNASTKSGVIKTKILKGQLYKFDTKLGYIVLTTPPENTSSSPEIGYDENTRLVKCTDTDGNDYYVNCPEGTGNCCSLAPLPQIDLTTPAEGFQTVGGIINSGISSINTRQAILLTFPPTQYANGAGTRSAIPSTRSKPGLRNNAPPPAPIGATVPLGEVLLKNNGGGIKIDTAIVIYWPPVRGKDDYRQIPPPNNNMVVFSEGTINDFKTKKNNVEDQNGQLIISRKRAKHMMSWQGLVKLRSDNENDEYNEAESINDTKSLDKSNLGVLIDTIQVIKWPEDFKKAAYKEASFEAMATFVATDGKFYFIDLDSDGDGYFDIDELASKIPAGTMLLKRGAKPKTVIQGNFHTVSFTKNGDTLPTYAMQIALPNGSNLEKLFEMSDQAQNYKMREIISLHIGQAGMQTTNNEKDIPIALPYFDTNGNLLFWATKDAVTLTYEKNAVNNSSIAKNNMYDMETFKAFYKTLINDNPTFAYPQFKKDRLRAVPHTELSIDPKTMPKK